MNLQLPPRRKWIIAGAVILGTATPSFALFGIGDIVFDPTSYASLISQLTQMTTQYNMLKTNLEHFSLKTQWQTTLNQMEHVNVANQFGETGGMTTAFNSNSPSAASTAWGNATVPVNSSASTYLASQSPEQHQPFAARDGRGIRRSLTRLHECSWCVPCRPRCQRFVPAEFAGRTA